MKSRKASSKVSSKRQGLTASTSLSHFKSDELPSSAVPAWFSVAGFCVGVVALAFFMAIVLISLFGFTIPTSSKFIVVIILALSCGLSVHFLGGSIAAKGKIPLPFAKDHPATIGLTGGSALTLIILITGYYLYVKNSESVEGLFNILENSNNEEFNRLTAFKELRDNYGWKDFSGRNLSLLDLPLEGWRGLNFQEANLRGVKMNKASARDVNFIRADFSNAQINQVDFRGSKLNGAVMRSANCVDCKLADVQLRGGDYDAADFSGSDLRFAWLMATSLKGAKFKSADLYGASFNIGDDPSWVRTDISLADFSLADLRNADLRNVIGEATAIFNGAFYDQDTKFPKDFEPIRKGMNAH